MDKEFNMIEIPYTDNFSVTFTYEQAKKTYNILKKLFDVDTPVWSVPYSPVPYNPWVPEYPTTTISYK